MLSRYIQFFLENKFLVWLLLLLFTAWGLIVAPFDFGIKGMPRDPVSIDAIPDIGENQQIVYTSWPGRSPQDIEDQISYPLSSSLLGIPGVKSIRSNSMFGFSSIYLIFEEEIDFYWSRSRILEKLNALPPNTLPPGVNPSLGPDATGLGQIFWYTLEGRDPEGNPTGGWNPEELRSIQDFYVRFGLSASEGISEVASVGGFVKEYQIDVDPEAMKTYGISMKQVMDAIRGSNLDVGAQTLEINRAEYFVRGLGYVKSIADIEQSVVKEYNNVPIRILDIAQVTLGPAIRRGVLDKSGAEAVGGVVVARYGANPLQVIQKLKEKIQEIEPGLPSKILADGRVSQVKIIPFYDRSQLIQESLGTLEEALSLEILITIIVVVLMLLNLRSSILLSSMLPLAVLMTFVAMKYLDIEANIVALAGIAIAIGTMVDMGIVLTESMVRQIERAPPEESLMQSIFLASKEVASAVVTAVASTIISFLPVFAMEAAEGKLFRPLAYTKTFALIASVFLALTVLPALAHSLFSLKLLNRGFRVLVFSLLLIAGSLSWIYFSRDLGIICMGIGLVRLVSLWIHDKFPDRSLQIKWAENILYAGIILYLLSKIWMPLGVDKSLFINAIFISLIVFIILGFFYVIMHFYEDILSWLLRIKWIFLGAIVLLLYAGFSVFQRMGEEFMPSLDEGSFLLMPTAMPHAGMQENLKNLRLLDMAVTAIPEVETVVGKAGRVESALDPAPMNMYENLILYKSEYKTDESGRRLRFRVDKDGSFAQNAEGELIPDSRGQYFRQWRDHIHSPDDIWKEIVDNTRIPGLTSAPKLQPIETRLIMLQTGMRAPMGIKIKGSGPEEIESFGRKLEQELKQVPGVNPASVVADRIVGKPYLLLTIKREVISRYGLSVVDVQNYLQTAVGGLTLTQTIEGRERYALRVRYPRELRDEPESLKRIFIPTSKGIQIPLGALVDITYAQGPQAIKSEDGFLTGYVLFDKEKGFAETEVVKAAQAYLQEKITSGTLVIPKGMSFRFAGNYEQQQRANQRLSIVLPLALALIFLVLYLQFRSFPISLMVFSGVFIAFAGGFLMLGLYELPGFLNVNLWGVNMRDLFQIHPINLSVAVWVGFLALFGIATDDGVLIATFLRDSFRERKPQSKEQIREAVIAGGKRRVRPALMTTATTLLALLPILSSTGRGADIMVPMAIPSFGGMLIQTLSMFTVPVLYALWQEFNLSYGKK